MIQKGEILVAGKGQIEIRLKGHPTVGVVMFRDDDENCSPCNPRHHDHVKCSVHYVDNRHVLRVVWQTHDARYVLWAAE